MIDTVASKVERKKFFDRRCYGTVFDRNIQDVSRTGTTVHTVVAYHDLIHQRLTQNGLQFLKEDFCQKVICGTFAKSLYLFLSFFYIGSHSRFPSLRFTITLSPSFIASETISFEMLFLRYILMTPAIGRAPY